MVRLDLLCSAHRQNGQMSCIVYNVVRAKFQGSVISLRYVFIQDSRSSLRSVLCFVQRVTQLQIKHK